MAGYGNPNLQPGPGRPVGSKTKRKVSDTRDLMDQLDRLDFDAVEDNVKMAREPGCPYSVRYKVNELFIKLLYPQLKTVAHTGQIEHKSIVMRWDDDPNAAAPAAIESAMTVVPSVDIPIRETVLRPSEDDVEC